MINEIFGKLKVVEYSGKNKRRESLWLCLCECGNKKIIKGYNLKIGKTKSCGCIKTGSDPKNRKGHRKGRLEFIEFVGMDKNRTSFWKARCECGNEIVLRSNSSAKSCGCLKVESDKNRSGNRNPNWNELLTDEDRSTNRNIEGYDDWSLQVKKNHKFTCFVCGDNKGGNLVSHHLESYSSSKDKRTQIENGVCLCGNCHIKFHKIYGYKNNTKEQFLDYLNKYHIFVKIKNKNKNEQLESIEAKN